MSAKHSGIPGLPPHRIAGCEITYCNGRRRGRLTPWILSLVVLSALSVPGTSSAHQAQSGTSAQQQQSPARPMHQSQQSVGCPMHEHQSEQGNPADQEQQRGQEPAQSHQQAPSSHDHDAMNQRGNAGMGFDQEKTTHHFRLLPDGGSIDVNANEATDIITRNEIRDHLRHIAGMFSAGDFSIPMFVHDQTPPGVDKMKQLREAIGYEYQETERGGRVEISTSDPEALEAIHSFLRFQIREHKTGDPLVPPKL
jgi:hypothetical protein